MSSQQENETELQSEIESGRGIYLKAIPLLIWVVLSGWFHLAYAGGRRAVAFLRGLPAGQILFLASCVGLIFTAFPAWVTYSVSFDGPEVVRIGSSFRALYVLPGFLGIFLAFTKVPFRLFIYLLAYVGCVAGYGAGFVFPHPVHTDMVNPADYGFTFLAYAYAVPLIGCGIFSRPGLSRSLVDWQILFTPLSEERADAQHGNRSASRAA